jgi:hypothetical protein
MKFFIIGMHASGKHEIAHQLENLGMKYGKCFSSVPNVNNVENLYAKGEFEQYNIMDISEVFENNAYIFIQEQPDNILNVSAHKYFEGLSKYTYDTNDVFVLSPDQFMSIALSNIPQDAVYIWLDNTKTNRQNKYKMEKREYIFNEREYIEKKDIKDFVKSLYNIANGKLLYFTNEDPGRVSAIIYSMYKHDDLINTYIEKFN